MFSFVKQRWRADGGYGSLLRVGLPLVLSNVALTAQLFLDSMFLSWYDPSGRHLSAVVPASILNFTILSFFLGTTHFASTFVAQYLGAGRLARIGEVMWQGVYFGLAAGGLLLVLAFHARSVLGTMPEPDDARIFELQVVYFGTIFFAAPAALVREAFMSFFSGRGNTRVMLAIAIVGFAINATLNWCLIFGNLGFPELGMRGAALATVCAIVGTTIVYAALVFRRPFRETFGTLRGWRFRWPLFARLIRYGVPNGLHIFLDVLGFTLFVMFVNTIDKDAGAANGLAVRVNTLAFMPMIGIGIAVSVLVGRYLTSGRPELARTVTWSGAKLCFAYMVVVALLFAFVPEVFIGLYRVGQEATESVAEPEAFSTVADKARVLLKFLALISLIDTGNIIFSGALRGAGDTRFVALTAMTASALVLVIPSYILVVRMESLYAGWGCVSAYITVLAVVYYLRFRGGRWLSMRVIEEEGE